MEILLQSTSAMAFYIFMLIMFEKLYSRRTINIPIKILFIVIAAAGMVAISFLNEPALNFLYSFLSAILLNKILYNPSGKSFIIYDIILIVIMMVIEMASVSLLAFIINKKLIEVLNSTWYSSAATVLNWILLFFAFRIYIFLISKKPINSIRTHELVLFSILVSGEIFFLHFINEILVLSKVNYELTIILAMFLLLDLYIAYLLRKISESYELEKEFELITQQSQLQLSAYKELDAKYNTSRKIIHDVRRHISSLEGLINVNNLKVAEEYKGLLNTELDKLVPRFNCDNPILSVIVNSKLIVAENMKIDFKLNIEFSELNFISDLDITVIFSNLIDNAFEACEKLPENKRYINLSVVRHNYVMFIYLENTYESINIQHDKYVSTKEYHQGIGLANVKSAIEKYNGNFNFSTEKGLFQSEIIIPIPETMILKSI